MAIQPLRVGRTKSGERAQGKAGATSGDAKPQSERVARRRIIEPAGSAPTSIPSKPTLAAPKQKVKAPKATKREATAADVMSSPAICCRAWDTLNTAAQLLWENDVGAVVVVDDDHRPVSMLTDRDICFAAYTQGAPLWQSVVESAMAKSLVTCPDSATVGDARGLLEQHRVRRLPVVDPGGRLVGILGLADLSKEMAGPASKLVKRGTTPAQLGQTLQRIYS